MEGAGVMQAKTQVSSMDAGESGVSFHQVPLPFLRDGETAHIVKVRGKEELQRHLENMGFVAGATIKAVSQVSGNMIVEIKGTQVALSQQVATHIITTASA